MFNHEYFDRKRRELNTWLDDSRRDANARYDRLTKELNDEYDRRRRAINEENTRTQSRIQNDYAMRANAIQREENEAYNNDRRQQAGPSAESQAPGKDAYDRIFGQGAYNRDHTTDYNTADNFSKFFRDYINGAGRAASSASDYREGTYGESAYRAKQDARGRRPPGTGPAQGNPYQAGGTQSSTTSKIDITTVGRTDAECARLAHLWKNAGIRYKDLAAVHHPDKGGSHDMMCAINAAYGK